MVHVAYSGGRFVADRLASRTTVCYDPAMSTDQSYSLGSDPVPDGVLEALTNHYSQADVSYRMVMNTLVKRLVSGTATENERAFVARQVERDIYADEFNFSHIYSRAYAMSRFRSEMFGLGKVDWRGDTMYDDDTAVFSLSSNTRAGIALHEFQYQVFKKWIDFMVDTTTGKATGYPTHNDLGIELTDGDILACIPSDDRVE
jgi:hypothetical protein